MKQRIARNMSNLLLTRLVAILYQHNEAKHATNVTDTIEIAATCVNKIAVSKYNYCNKTNVSKIMCRWCRRDMLTQNMCTGHNSMYEKSCLFYDG